QDPAAQYNLGIFFQNVILWDNQILDQVIDISSQLEETALSEIDQLIGSLDELINNSISILEEELNEQNPLEKLNEILKKLPTHAKSRENQIKTLEAYYYLETFIQENKANQEQIKERIQETN
ncbi:20631_t:CDS:2, partial [Cetraspora pellucida]